jgi:hypothetical protein
MKKILINILLLFIISVNLFGKSLNETEVYSFAKKWLTENGFLFHYGEFKESSKVFEIRTIEAIKNKDGDVLLYVVELNPKGFILLSSDNRLKPIIGYSSENNFNYKDDDIFINAIKSDLKDNLVRIERENISTLNEQWVEYSSPKVLHKTVKGTEDIHGPFLESDWGQGYVNGKAVYNYYSPNQWPTGCVATATAQILNYYKWPYQGNGSNGYFDNGQYLSADFGKTFYDWENTLDLYTDQSFNLDNQKAAGLLVYHCAVALEMDFEYNGSTANTSDVPGIMHDYFRGSGHYESVTSTGFWDEMKSNMFDQRPAIISIKSTSHSIGHAAVVDGYFATNNYYHVNPGWYGDNTGWYDISGEWNMGSYDIVVGATKGIVPSPQINEAEILSDSSFIISWRTSRNQNADYYELQQASSQSGPWTTLSNSIVDTTYQIDNAELGSYYYQVRANRDSIWWDYSVVKKIQLGTERRVTFNVDMTYRPLEVGDTVVIRGNIPPLAGNVNSDAMVKEDSSNVYKLDLDFDYDYSGQTIIYRYFIQSNSDLIAEGQNREYVLTSEPMQEIATVYFDDVVGVDDKNYNTPNDFKLEQNYPNPFNPTTVIKYSIPVAKSATKVVLKVYDILGKEVATLVNKEQSAGKYSISFNANKLSAGIYFYQIRAGQFLETKKMTLIK